MFIAVPLFLFLTITRSILGLFSVSKLIIMGDFYEYCMLWTMLQKSVWISYLLWSFAAHLLSNTRFGNMHDLCIVRSNSSIVKNIFASESYFSNHIAITDQVSFCHNCLPHTLSCYRPWKLLDVLTFKADIFSSSLWSCLAQTAPQLAVKLNQLYSKFWTSTVPLCPSELLHTLSSSDTAQV